MVLMLSPVKSKPAGLVLGTDDPTTIRAFEIGQVIDTLFAGVAVNETVRALQRNRIQP